jgi:FkbM family methyltransferase
MDQQFSSGLSNKPISGPRAAFFTLIRLVGSFGAIRFLFARAFRQSEVLLSLKSTHTKIRLRPRNSDFEVLLQTFATTGCETRQWIKKAEVIVDAGANIGLTSILFASHYPGATIIAVEPDEQNFRLLLENCAAFPTVVPVRAALWPRKASISVRDPGKRSWGLQTEESSNDEIGTCPAITMADIFERYGHVNLMKMDIEGAEWPLLEEDCSWIDSIDVLVVELHGSNKEERLKTALQNRPLKIQKQEEKHVIVKIGSGF